MRNVQAMACLFSRTYMDTIDTRGPGQVLKHHRTELLQAPWHPRAPQWPRNRRWENLDRNDGDHREQAPPHNHSNRLARKSDPPRIPQTIWWWNRHIPGLSAQDRHETQSQANSLQTSPQSLGRKTSSGRRGRPDGETGNLGEITSIDWIHPMVMVLKPDGNIWSTTDLSSLNQWDTTVHNSILVTKDVFMELTIAKHFKKLDLKKRFSRHFGTGKPKTHNYRNSKGPLPVQTLDYKWDPKILLKPSEDAWPRHSQESLGCKPHKWHPGLWCNPGGTRSVSMGGPETTPWERLSAQYPEIPIQDHQIHFLGHIIENGKISIKKKNVMPTQRVAEPSNKKEVKVFLGMVTYHKVW